MSYANVKSYRNRLKERALYVMGEKCQVCGYDKCITALEFHHINPEEKEMSFNGKDNCSWDKTREELKKCILLCANCHREAHMGLIDSALLTPSFVEERAKEIDSLVQETKEGKIWYCKSCGVEVTRGNTRCASCAAKDRRVTADKERPTREELKQLIRTTSFVELGRRYGVSDNAIRKWCDTYHLPRKATEIKQYTNEEWESI
jgi:hypothetical protein